MKAREALRRPPNKRTRRARSPDKGVLCSPRRRVADLRRCAALLFLALSLAFAISPGSAAELLESVELVNGGAVLSCDYTHPDGGGMFICRDAYSVFALHCVSAAWSALNVQRTGQQEFLCPVSAGRSAFGNALRLRCTAIVADSRDNCNARPQT
jgi:hypothetical protein